MTQDSGLTPRHFIAVTALISGVVATYLHLWKLGLAGTLACGGSGGCAAVQFSPWSYFLGIDVALIGAVGYSLILIVSLIGTSPSRVNEPKWTRALALLIVPAFIFTLRLKYYEFFVMHTFCPWCAVSAVTITLHMILLGLDWRRTSGKKQEARSET
jgi:uncharacterized membrane protein